MCSVCNYAAESQSALEAHLRKHTEDPTKAYFCHSCDSRFSTRKRWDLHLPKHQMETPFICQVHPRDRREYQYRIEKADTKPFGISIGLDRGFF